MSVLAALLLGLWPMSLATGHGSETTVREGPTRLWPELIRGAEALHLPTAFLKNLPPDFVTFEFEDLHTYAAEYHPGEHRLVLNRTLSFNAAGRTLAPLDKMTHKDLGLLYHELFHAYMDYLHTGAAREGQDRLLAFARTLRRCRYGEVRITPVLQRPRDTETRYLTEAESWEALNETWAVFIGWAIWHQLEVQRSNRTALFRHRRTAQDWAARLEQAFRNGEFRGYYVPEDPEERRVALKRFLAIDSQLSGMEALTLMKEVLGFPSALLQIIRARPGMEPVWVPLPGCREDR